MTIFLAAITGNVLAWLIYGFTWWMRQRAFSALCFFGVVGFLEMMFASQFSKSFYWILLIWLTVFGIGRIQSNWLTQVSEARIWSATLAFVGELFIAQFVALAIVLRLPFFQPANNSGTFALSAFCFTLFLLALFRPPVVRFSQRFRTLLRPQRNEPTA